MEIPLLDCLREIPRISDLVDGCTLVPSKEGVSFELADNNTVLVTRLYKDVMLDGIGPLREYVGNICSPCTMHTSLAWLHDNVESSINSYSCQVMNANITILTSSINNTRIVLTRDQGGDFYCARISVDRKKEVTVTSANKMAMVSRAVAAASDRALLERVGSSGMMMFNIHVINGVINNNKEQKKKTADSDFDVMLKRTNVDKDIVTIDGKKFYTFDATSGIWHKGSIHQNPKQIEHLAYTKCLKFLFSQKDDNLTVSSCSVDHLIV